MDKSKQQRYIENNPKNACKSPYSVKVTEWHFEFWGYILKYEGYLTPIKAKLIKHVAENFIKTKNDLFKPNTENNGKNGKT